MTTNDPPPRLVLYMKPGCHLCEQAEADLARLRPHQPHTLELIDISHDAELMQRYGLRIPVLTVAGREYDAPLDVRQLERALAEAMNGQTTTPPPPPTVRAHGGTTGAQAHGR